jgi:hypothetical protein
MPLSDVETGILQALDVERAYGHLEYLVTRLPGRYAGSDQEPLSAEYIRSVLEGFGVANRIITVDTWLGVPLGASLQIHGPTEFEIKSSPRTPTQGPITAELLGIETKEEARAKESEIAGRIVVCPYSYGLPITPEEIATRGGVGTILGNWGPSDLDVLRVYAPQTWLYWGVPTPEEFAAGPEELRRARRALPPANGAGDHRIQDFLAVGPLEHGRGRGGRGRRDR